MKNKGLIVAGSILVVCIIAFIIVNVYVGKSDKSTTGNSENSPAVSNSAGVNDKDKESQQSDKESQQKAETGYLTYKNEGNNFTIQYPGDWQQRQNDMGTGAAFLAPSEGDSDQYQETITLVAQDLSQGTTNLTQFTNLSIQQIKQTMTDCKVEESGDVNVAGEKGYRMVYSGSVQGLNLKVMSVWTIKNNKAYVFTYAAEVEKYSEYKEYAEKSLKTFGFIK